MNAEQARTWKALVDNTLEIPDTWEVALSAGKNKKETWEHLIAEKRLGDLAFLRNLRNMVNSGVYKDTLKERLLTKTFSNILPFQFIAAAKAAPSLEPEIEYAMLLGVASMEHLSGRTALLVDVSGSMDRRLSVRGEMMRSDVANGLAILCRELCDDVDIFTFSSKVKQIPARRGFALADAIQSSQPHSSTRLGEALREVSKKRYDRVIVLTDEQSHDAVKFPEKSYVINISTERHGVSYQNNVTHIDGWSENVLKYIYNVENED
jgi:hypothetical protein